MKLIQTFKTVAKKNKTLLFLGVFISLWSLFYFRYHIIYPGVSKIIIANAEGNIAKLTIPNEMIYGQSEPIHGQVDFVVLDLEPGVLSGRSPKYSLWLDRNGNNDSLLRLTLPWQIGNMDEVESDFIDYKKYANVRPQGTSVFMLVGKKRNGWPTYIQCSHGQQISQTQQRLKKCTYYGIYSESLTYKFSFPGEELKDISQLIIYVQNTITLLLDKE
jgi:hypothetical protein